LGHGGYVWEENLKEAVNRILYQHTGAEDIYFAAIQKFSNLNHSYGVLKKIFRTSGTNSFYPLAFML
jgi:hypothetical protein